MGRLDNKVAIITGGAMGLGAADSTLFAKEGAKVILTDVASDAGQKIADEIGATFMQQDVTDEERWKEIIAETVNLHGKLDILVNNAGIVEVGDPENQTTAEYRKTMAVHMDSTFFGCKYSIPVMAETGGGSIVNMCSIASVQGESYVAAYCAAKGAIEAYTRAVAVHCGLKKNGVRCNSIHPSGIATPMVASVPDKMNAKFGAAPNQDAPVSKTGEPIDIAYAALYLASDESKFMNGAQLRVDNAMSVASGTMPE
ncbi:MAG: SDR family oxidoreductase [Pseudomonadota bacterium]|nr:SDR family oxidoreductase [Pseudomonadota bacterium]MEE3294575.1 SDR family oxidoreductase [Pseudomonadota bacterium]|tara:strand:- start:555 stop:1322 length:768 start_codon:yes stop_codon:yes gene_type:complete